MPQPCKAEKCRVSSMHRTVLTAEARFTMEVRLKTMSGNVKVAFSGAAARAFYRRSCLRGLNLDSPWFPRCLAFLRSGVCSEVAEYAFKASPPHVKTTWRLARARARSCFVLQLAVETRRVVAFRCCASKMFTLE